MAISTAQVLENLAGDSFPHATRHFTVGRSMATGTWFSNDILEITEISA